MTDFTRETGLQLILILLESPSVKMKNPSLHSSVYFVAMTCEGVHSMKRRILHTESPSHDRLVPHHAFTHEAFVQEISQHLSDCLVSLKRRSTVKLIY